MQPKKLEQVVAAKAVIEADGKILILHPSDIDPNRKWHIPGGRRDDINEPIEDTAKREVKEETGIDLSNYAGAVFKVGEWFKEDEKEKYKILAVFFHFALPGIPEVCLSKEHDEYAWINLDNCREYDSNKEVNEIIENIFAQGLKP